MRRSSLCLTLLASLAMGHVCKDGPRDEVEGGVHGGDSRCAELAAMRYLDSLIEKHGARLQKEIEYFNLNFEKSRLHEADGIDYDSDTKWHVGDVSLTVLDKHAFSTMLNTVEKRWRLPLKLLGRLHLPDLGLFFLSIGYTDIFEQL